MQKSIILDEDGSTLFSCYHRHHADIRRALAGIVDDMKNRLGDADVRVALTGSAAIGIAEELGVPFVQEVVATTRALKAAYPEADAAIELGGEDAKVVYLSGGLEQRMNATCAGGAGGFIDTIAFMLDVDPADMSALAFKARTIHPIASRCAVFAQTDVRPLLNAGASKADIAASAYDAVTRQTIGGLACGRPVKGTASTKSSSGRGSPSCAWRGSRVASARRGRSSMRERIPGSPRRGSCARRRSSRLGLTST